MRNTNYLKRYNDQISKFSIEEDIPEDEVNFIIDQFFYDLKDVLTDSRIPTVKITNLGTFKTTIGKLKWHINICHDKIKKGIGDAKILQDRIDYLTSILERLQQEKEGKNTWNVWKKKKNSNEEKSKNQKQKSKR